MIMATTTTPPTTAPPSHATTGRRTRFVDAVAFEWIKVRSIRSTWWTLFAAAFITVGVAVLAGQHAEQHENAAGVLREVYVGLPLGQLALCLFGVLAATSEYGTGSIRSTFTAVPHRPRLLAAKALVVFAVSLVTGLLISFAAYGAGSLSTGPGVTYPALSDGAVLRAVVGAGCYLGVLGVCALALGLVLRASAGGITAAVSVTFILPIVFRMLGDSGRPLVKWWPTEAGQQVLHVFPSPQDLGPLPGLGYFAAFTVIAFIGATVLVNRRDA
ncbi:ABC transporter permease [Streptomyces kronopolitis]|uniref:ABC transporter permease n=1 Tax=Streptomyces kronopolitis TaxID=1612435 RepID=UPI003429F6A5